MDPNQLINFVMQRKWVGVAAFVIALTVRLLKSDTKIPINIPPQLRVWLALGLGGASGALYKLVDQNVTWTSALTQGLVAAVIAIVSHNTVVASMRGGREFVVPGLIKADTPPGPGKPPSIKPPAPKPPIVGVMMMLLGVGFLVWGLVSCALFKPATVAKVELAGEEIACVLERAFVDDPTLDAICKFIDPATGQPSPAKQALGHQLAAQYRLQAKRDAALHAEICAPIVNQLMSHADGGVQ